MKRSIYPYSFVLLLAFLSACKVSKDISLPKSAIPETFRDAGTIDSTSIGSVPLAIFFAEKEIQDLIQNTLTTNFDMQTAIKNIESAELLFKQLKLGRIPTLNFQLNANSSRPSENSLNGLSSSEFLGTRHIEDFNASLGLGWEADIWGKIKGKKQAALAAYLQTGEAKKAIQTRLVADIAQGYYKLLMMDAQLGIANKSLSLNDSTLQIIKMQFNAGQVTSLAVQQAEAQCLVAARLVPQFEQAIAIQENALRILAGEAPSAIRRLSTLELISVPGHLSAGVPSAMVSRRPDVKAFEYALSVANAKVGVAKADMYPSLNITASGGINSLKASNWFNIPSSLFGLASGAIAQPIFQRKQLKIAYELAKIDREKVVIGFRQTVLNAVGEVSDELIKIEKLKSQYEISQNRVSVLRQAMRNAGLLFKSGMANYLEVITAQSNFLQSELELATVKTAQLNATVELYRSLGGGY